MGSTIKKNRYSFCKCFFSSSGTNKWILSVSLSSNEDVDEGYVLNKEGIGLRLTAMEYWKCSETGIKLPFTDRKQPDCKFVIAESLPEQGHCFQIVILLISSYFFFFFPRFLKSSLLLFLTCFGREGQRSLVFNLI